MPFRIVFSHGYFIQLDAKEQPIMRPYPPLGLLYLSAFLQQHGFANEVFDNTFYLPHDFKQYLLKNPPHVLAFNVNLLTKLHILPLVNWIREQPSLQNTIIVLGGPDVTHNTDAYIQAGADAVIYGEGEQTMLALVQALSSGYLPTDPKAMQPISGLVWRNASTGQITQNLSRPALKNIDDLPQANWQAINMHQYIETWKKHHGFSSISVSTQRGCPYTCKWCSTAVFGQSYRRRAPKLVVKELEYLRQNYNMDLIWFVDDVFTVSHKWLQAFANELKAQNFSFAFECITRADRLNTQVLELLHQTGCVKVWIGAESGSQSVINAMDRRVNIGHVQKMLIGAKKLGIKTGTFIMLGYPTETHADIVETVAHLKIANPDFYTITTVYPIKGTPLYTEVAPQNSNFMENWAASSNKELIFKRTYPEKYYYYAIRWVVNEFLFFKLQKTGKTFHPRAVKAKLKAWAAWVGMFFYKQTTS